VSDFQIATPRSGVARNDNSWCWQQKRTPSLQSRVPRGRGGTLLPPALRTGEGMKPGAYPAFGGVIAKDAVAARGDLSVEISAQPDGRG